LIRALIFDFDGLILDTEEPIYRSWQEIYEEHGVELPFERWIEIVGSSTAAFHPQIHLEQRLGRPLPAEVIDRRAARRTELVLAQHVLPGVVSHMESARLLGIKLGVASSSSRDWVAGHLERLGILDRVDCLRTREDVVHVKPEPDLYVSVLDCLGAAAGDALAIEDSPNGIIAAKSAGLRCVAVPNPITAGLDLSLADLIISSLSEVTLPQLLERLGMA